MQFSPHICMWVIHRSLLQAVLEDLGLPQCGSGVEVTWLLGSWEPSSAKCAGKLATLGSGDTSLLGFFLASGSSATMRTEYGGGTGCLDCGDFWGARCTEKSVAMGAEDMTLLEFFSSLWKLTLREPLWLILIYYLAEGAVKWQPWLGVLLCSLYSRHSKNHLCWDLSLLVSCQCCHVGRESLQ